MKHEVIIIGSGPAGLTAAIYAARANLNPLVLAGVSWGGQLMTTTDVENFPGFENGIQGPELMQKMLNQAERFGAQIIYSDVTKIGIEQMEDGKNDFKVYTYDNEYSAKSIIIATGAISRKLGIKGESEFWAKGVSTCATCDGAFFKEKIVAVIGGGDSAMEESSFLTRFASKVYLIHRRNEFKASKIMQERVKNNPKIELVLNSEVKEIIGEQKVTGIKIVKTDTGDESLLKVDGVFLAIGHIPVTDFLGKSLELGPNGYISSLDGVKTNVEGIFVAGDVEDYKYKQAITAAGAGCKAALEAEKWLSVQ